MVTNINNILKMGQNLVSVIISGSILKTQCVKLQIIEERNSQQQTCFSKIHMDWFFKIKRSIDSGIMIYVSIICYLCNWHINLVLTGNFEKRNDLFRKYWGLLFRIWVFSGYYGIKSAYCLLKTSDLNPKETWWTGLNTVLFWKQTDLFWYFWYIIEIFLLFGEVLSP